MKFLILILFFCLTAIPVRAENPLEAAMLAAFFSPKPAEKGVVAYSGDAAKRYEDLWPRPAEFLPKEAEVTFRLLLENDAEAVYEAQALAGARVREWTVFFSRSPLGSRISSVQSLFLPPYLFDRLLPQLEKKTERSSEEEKRLRQLQILAGGVPEMRNNFQRNRSIYENISRLLVDGKNDEALAAARKSDLTDVRLYGETPSEGAMILQEVKETSGRKKVPANGADLRLSGFLDSMAGYFWLPAGVAPPPLSPDDFLLIEPLEDGWFLYKRRAAPPPVQKKEEA